MKALWAIATNSCREFFREKIVWISIFLGVFMFLFSLLLGTLSLNEKARILFHFGFLAIQCSGLFIVFFLGSSVISREIDKQTCLLVLARPLTREQFILGKILGLTLTGILITSLLSVFLYALLAVMGIENVSIERFFLIYYGTFCEFFILLLVAFMVSLILRPSLAGLATLTVFLLGHWTQDMQFFAKKMNNSMFAGFGRFFEFTIPNLYQMNWRAFYFIEHDIPASQVSWVTVHSAAWAVLLTAVTLFIFRRKDLV